MKLRKTFIIISLILAVAFDVAADFPQGYYDSLEGLTKEQLKEAAKKKVRPHTAITYNSGTWEAFEKTDVKIVNGREAWWDMYSDNIVYVSEGHPGMNIEHSVANSWWGGSKNDAYKDLFHLNPSDSEANGWKSNYPLGIVVEVKVTSKGVRYDNGVTKVGKPASGASGGASLVYEPADCYKGDFARAFFYMFTVYDDISWMTSSSDRNYMFDGTSWPSLRPWAYQMLLDWARQDPVDEKEINRNEAIYKIQGNRNPYIDIPELAEYVWGSRTAEPFHLNTSSSQTLVAPIFVDAPESGKWWEPFSLHLTASEGDIVYALGEDAYSLYPEEGISIPQAEYPGQQLKIRARSQLSKDGEMAYSSVVTLTLTAVDPNVAPPVQGEWVRMQAGDAFSSDGVYAIIETKDYYAMSYNISSSKSASMLESTTSSAEFSDSSKGTITTLPNETALLHILPSGSNYNIEVMDESRASLGWLCSTSAKNLYLTNAISTGCAASISFEATDAVISFSGAGKLQYNTAAPRFTTYTSEQGKIAIYRFVEAENEPPQVGVQTVDAESEVRSEDRNIIAPAGSVAFDSSGRQVRLSSLSPGLYIVKTPTSIVKIIVK